MNREVQTEMYSSAFKQPCWCCGSTAGTRFRRVLWPELCAQWALSDEEQEYIDRQQGEECEACGSSLRTQALAKAVLLTFRARGPFEKFVRTLRGRSLRILEINQAGELTKFFSRLSLHELWEYPRLDMMNMPANFGERFDLILHGDTLEHVPDPVRGLAECHRALKPGGALCFTVPMIVGRLTRSRSGLAPSFHMKPGPDRDDFLVHTEYGADAWRQLIDAGFSECRIIAIRPPIAHALIGIKAR